MLIKHSSQPFIITFHVAGLECFVREGKRAKHPDGDVKGRCRSVAVGEPADVPAEEEPAQDNN